MQNRKKRTFAEFEYLKDMNFVKAIFDSLIACKLLYFHFFFVRPTDMCVRTFKNQFTCLIKDNDQISDMSKYWAKYLEIVRFDRNAIYNIKSSIFIASSYKYFFMSLFFSKFPNSKLQFFLTAMAVLIKYTQSLLSFVNDLQYNFIRFIGFHQQYGAFTCLQIQQPSGAFLEKFFLKCWPILWKIPTCNLFLVILIFHKQWHTPLVILTGFC